MRYVAAYCLFALSGKAPNAKDLEKVLGSVGVDCDAAKAKKVVSELEGKVLEDVIKNGMAKLGTMPAGGGGGGGGGGGSGPVASSGGAAPAKEEAKEVKPEEPEEESDDDMGFGLFD
ncbi:60S acidic ribosomal protein P2 [Chionoecetes opilio]|uniref:Large ribosomal subunit protein P2 n=1 Tax=Chionoecetes opilio TaxID=41210 RepID=A0A8J4XY85_CHIOP|nr:60S acidic ribosomal protein P2 [Chionoecetes opilio]